MSLTVEAVYNKTSLQFTIYNFPHSHFKVKKLPCLNQCFTQDQCPALPPQYLDW